MALHESKALGIFQRSLLQLQSFFYYGHFMQLLQSLSQYIVDPLDILELVDAEKPLRALDFCYQMDPDALSILDAISLCVTVCAYSADTHRSHQMLVSGILAVPYCQLILTLSHLCVR